MRERSKALPKGKGFPKKPGQAPDHLHQLVLSIFANTILGNSA